MCTHGVTSLRYYAHMGCVYGAGVQSLCAVNTGCLCPLLYAVCVQGYVLSVCNACASIMCFVYTACVACGVGRRELPVTASPSYQPWAGGRRVSSSATVLASAGRRVIREGLSEEVTLDLRPVT